MADEEPQSEVATPAQPLKCGIVRPIASMDGYSSAHWEDVHKIVEDALSSAGFDVALVSEADAIGVIHGRIVKNLYEVDLVVCDVSGKNPNVMFELGMRLAFDKPTIVIKDDQTSYSFDTSPIEHIPYPRDLRYASMVKFKGELVRKAIATVNAKDDPNHKTFLQHFGPIRVAVLEHQSVPSDQYMLNEMQEMKAAFVKLTNSLSSGPTEQWRPKFVNKIDRSSVSSIVLIKIADLTESEVFRLVSELKHFASVSVALTLDGNNEKVLSLTFDPSVSNGNAKSVISAAESLLAIIRTERHLPEIPL